MDDPDNIAAKAAAAETARLKAITTGDAGKFFPEVARTIAFSTKLTASEAAAIFDAILIDFDSVLASKSPAIPEALTYAEQKRQAGALGLEKDESYDG